MKLCLECQYCGYKWEQVIDHPDEVAHLRCLLSDCYDTNIKMTKYDQEKSDVFGYNSDAPKEDAYFRR
jgi:hypothetical protein